MISNDFREEYDYLLLKNPKPSRAILKNDSYVRYTRSSCASSNCVSWEQPLNFIVNRDLKQWNILELNNKSFSQSLKNLRNECSQCGETYQCLCKDNSVDPCDDTLRCEPFKYALTATDTPSDIIFYTDLHEISTEINYYAVSSFEVSATLKYTTDNTITEFEYSGDNVNNLNNDGLSAYIAWEVNKIDLVSENELGFLLPDAYSIGKWDSTIKSYDKVGKVFSNGILANIHSESLLDFDISKIKMDGCLYGYSNTCEFVPYTKTTNHINQKNNCNSNTESSNDIYFSDKDIFGNEYFLYKENLYNSSIWTKKRLSGLIEIKTINGEILDIADIYINNDYVDLNVIYDTLVMETDTDLSICQIYQDWDTGLPYTTPDTNYVLSGTYFAHELNPKEKELYICYLSGSNIMLTTYDLDNNKFYKSEAFDISPAAIPSYGQINSRPRGMSISFNPGTDNLYIFAIGTYLSTQGIMKMCYKKDGKGFIYKDSTLISDQNIDYLRIMGSMVINNDDISVAMVNANTDISHIIKI